MNVNIRELPLEDRIRLVEDLWDSIAQDQHALALTPEQNAAVKESYDRMRQSAVQLGEQIIDQEKALNDAFAAGNVLPERVKELVTSIAELKGKLRFVHLQAHLEMRELLSPKQIQQYDQLRGYGSHIDGGHSGHKHQH